MESASQTKASEIFRANGGTLRTSQILRLGIHPRTLYQMRESGRVIQLSRGVYRLADIALLANSDLATAAIRVPNGVVCLVSALSFHEITSEIPHEVYLAIPTGKEKPKVDFPPTRVFHFSSDSYSAGVEELQMGGNPIKIYSKEKTVADCFKFRNRIGLDVAIDALRQCIRKGGSRSKIMDFSRICRVENVIRPYLEAT
ncbi:MAG: type IV toxin-antitoxin system AbiEi family antitoxin domain-containing protein [Acidobacteria bacterium]|nr:type IV toxin-antitoxin system AbiEi family antitoxin domain-containing protein [Acidobacteriota bacterium]